MLMASKLLCARPEVRFDNVVLEKFSKQLAGSSQEDDDARAFEVWRLRWRNAWFRVAAPKEEQCWGRAVQQMEELKWGLIDAKWRLRAMGMLTIMVRRWTVSAATEQGTR